MKHLRLVFTLVVFGAVLVGVCTRHDPDSWGAGGEFPTVSEVPKPRFERLPAEGGDEVLRAQVRDGKGIALAGIAVHLRSGDTPFWGFTDASGRIGFQGLLPGEVDVVAYGFRRRPRVVRLATGPEVHTIELDEETPFPAPLPNLVRTPLAGMIEAPEGGPPLAPEGYEVHLLPLDPVSELGPVPRRVRTDSDGGFTLEALAHGRYRALVVPSWAAGTAWPDLTAPDLPVIEHPARDGSAAGPGSGDDPDDDPQGGAGGTATGVRIRLATGSIEGVVLDDVDRPLEDALVIATLEGQPNRLWPPSVSDGDGRFRVSDLPAGEYRLTVRAGEGTVETRVQVEPGPATRVELPPLVPRLRPPGG